VPNISGAKINIYLHTLPFETVRASVADVKDMTFYIFSGIMDKLSSSHGCPVNILIVGYQVARPSPTSEFQALDFGSRVKYGY
jgi:hypothetical protein